MRVTVYDKKPGVGLSQWFLSFFWAAGCFIQKLFGKVDAYYGATSWDDAMSWLVGRPGTLTSVQYWGHGSPGIVWLAQMAIPLEKFIFVMKQKVDPSSILWWRTCSSFQGAQGHAFSKRLADSLGCTIAGHTRIIGPVQGGLHTRKPLTEASWPVTEGELPKSWLPGHLRWGPHSIFCLTTKIPSGW
jgi:hypothetical protein